VDEAVRDLLALRAVKLHPAEDAPQIHGFRCLGVAERIPELGQTPGSTVQVWHVPSDILPISSAEIERWSVDAPGGRHWILSERPYDDAIMDSLKSMEVVIWGPERMARWIGDAVLAGELVAHSSASDDVLPKEQDEVVLESDIDLTALRPVVDIGSWLIQRGWEDADASPVLLSARLWTVEGILRGPEGDGEAGIWRVIEDPWSKSLYPHEPEEMLPHAPRLRVLEPDEEDWSNIRLLPDELLKLLDRRKRGEPDDQEGPVSSIMLEWWRLDSDTAVLSNAPIVIPGWVIEPEGTTSQVLHGRNGRLYRSE